MRLGVISDTHGFLRREVFEVFKQVDHILHAGDVGTLDILEALESLAPVTAVHGNVDQEDIRRICPAVQKLELEGLNVVVTHGHRVRGGLSPDSLHQEFPEAELIVHGHTHVPILTLVDEVVTVLNPGAAGRVRLRPLASVAIMELEAGLPPRGRIVPLMEDVTLRREAPKGPKR